MKKTSFALLTIATSIFSGCTNHAQDKMIADALNECKKPYSIPASSDDTRLLTLKLDKPPYDTWANADYGQPIAKIKLEETIRQGLKDPYSALVSCEEPVKTWYQKSGFDSKHIFKPNGSAYGCFAAEPHYGYSFICTVNAKNGFGAYTGESKTLYFQEGSPKKDFYKLSGIEDGDFHVIQ